MTARQPIDLLTDRLESEGPVLGKLTLDRYAAGELSAEEAAVVEAHLAADPDAQAHLDAVEAARADVPAFDFAALQQRAKTVEPAPPQPEENAIEAQPAKEEEPAEAETES